MISETQEYAGLPAQVITDAPLTASSPARRLRIIELVLVLAVAFSGSIVGSLIVLATGASIAGHYDTTRMAMSVCSEISSLAVLAYVLYRQRRTWRDITESPDWKDVPRAFAVVVVTSIVYALAYYTIQYTSFALTNAWLRPKSLNQLLAVGISSLSLLFVLLNPFFEELIVRAYLMSEIRALGGTRAIAVLVSVAVQVSYHLYQGWLNAALVGSMFLMFSIYYAKTRRIGPVILAHMFADVTALLTHHA